MNKNTGNASLKSVLPSESTRFSSLHILTCAAVMGAMLVAARYFGAAPLRELLRWILGLGSTAPLVFIPSYVGSSRKTNAIELSRTMSVLLTG